MPNKKKVFISYRVSGAKFAAHYIYKHLKEQGCDVFLDEETIKSGRFENVILKEISDREHFVVILNKESVQKTQGTDDWMIKEVQFAIEKNRNIVPVLVDDFNFKKNGDLLHGPLQRLMEYTGIEFKEGFYEDGLRRLCRFLGCDSKRSTRALALAIIAGISLVLGLYKLYDVYEMGVKTENWTEITRGFDDNDKREKRELEQYKANLRRSGPQISGYIVEPNNARWNVFGREYGNKTFVLNYHHEKDKDRELGTIISKRSTEEGTDTFKGYWLGYDRRKDDLVVCPDILTKLPPEEVKQLHERYLRSKCFYAGVFDRIASTGKVRVGISIDINSPFVCLNETKGELMGFDVELVGKVIESLGKNVKPEFLAYQWTGLFEALRDNDVDLAISAISRSPNREKDFDFQFSRRYYATSQSYTFFSKHAVPNIGNLKRTGRRLIVHRHTTSLSLARTLMPDIDIDMVDSPRAAFEWLIQIDPRGVVVTDSEIARYLEKKLGRALTEKTKRDHGVLKTIPINMVGHQGGEQHFEDEYGIAVKDRGLLAKVNEELEKFDKSGDLGTLRTKWLSNKPTPCEK